MRRILFTLCLLLLTVGPVSAQSPEKQREFVYGVNALTGLEYEGASYPLSVDTIYLMADVTNIVSPRESLVYFWPLTNQYQIDWDEMNETVAGTLEIVQRGQVVHTITQTEYIVQYPNGLDTGVVYVYTGEEAQAQYAEFDRQRRAFRDSVAAYYEASRAYRQEQEEKIKTGKVEAEPPPPPAEPAPFLFFSTAPHDGFPVKLPAGNYQIRLRGEDGQVVPQSQRRLVSFAPERTGISYTIVPHDKYTIPEQSNDPAQILYVRAGTQLYLQPFTEHEFNNLYLTRLREPQSTLGNIDRWTWMPLIEYEGGTLQFIRNGEVFKEEERHNYVVRQITGNALGYEIHDQATVEEERLRTRRPDFEGFPLLIEVGEPAFQIQLVDANGMVLPGSQRTVQLVQTQATGSFFFLPLVPLVIGAGVWLWRRGRYSKLPKENS